MKKGRFSVTFERISPDELYPEERGFLEREVTVYEAIRSIHRDAGKYTAREWSEPSDYPESHTRWWSVSYSDWRTGSHTTYSIHFPENTTPASRARLCRYMERHA